MQYCINNNIKLSNNSYGFCAQSSSYPAALYDRFKQARDQIGHLAVAGAGNYIPFDCAGLNNDLSAVWPAGFGEDEPNNPGLGSVIAVAATNNQDRLWASGGSESHYGANSVHLAAPGQDVCSTERVPDPGCPDPSQDSCEAIGNSCYSYKSGTSLSAAYVTGVAALLWSQVPTWDYLAVKNRILGSVRVLNCSTEDASCIVGRTITGGVVSARGAIWDCNNNTIDDDDDITNGPSQDCFGYESNCCFAHEGPNCEDTEIRDCVCIDEGFDAFCCCPTCVWNLFCVDTAAGRTAAWATRRRRRLRPRWVGGPGRWVRRARRLLGQVTDALYLQT